MSNEEKLRALLAEARYACESLEFEPCSENRKHARGLKAQIDAALAEPVGDYDVDADLRMHKEDRLRLRSENLRLERERNEARAEVRRTYKELSESIAREAAAYERGAAAMREAAARELDRLLTEKKATAIWVAPDEIRALPVPEDK